MKNVFFSVLIFFSLEAFAQDTVAVGLLQAPPYGDESRPGQGLICEVISAAFQESGHSARFYFLPYPRLLPATVAGKLLACTAVEESLSPADRNEVWVTKPFIVNNMVLFYKKSLFPHGLKFGDLSELKGYSVEIINGFPAEVEKFRSKGLIVDATPTTSLVMKKLAAERVQLALSGDLGGLEELRKAGLDEDKFGFTPPFESFFIFLVFSKKYPGAETLLAEFNSGLRTIVKTGTYLAILEKYYGKGKVPPEVLKRVQDW